MTNRLDRTIHWILKYGRQSYDSNNKVNVGLLIACYLLVFLNLSGKC